ncbi:MAG: hypothetical protein A3E78_03850 [Alphaproteobacteria bacterium RIFCSPHIGHO2_12_FULL_63_12]|nr:MAG: hypothetical protein A3E78_03850 [Alphaproteobacteria bacterium RIFCSPHIGHO2_12_FULL_63_12]
MKKLAALLLSAFWFAAGASASAQDDEIIVTGSRISSYESDTVPVIHLNRRADFMVIEVIVESDSRDAKVRKDEVFKALTALADRADRDQRIDLGIRRTFETDNDEMQVVEPFSRNSIRDEILSGGARVDTSRAIVVAKTPIDAGDTFDAAHARLTAFIKGAVVNGRATVTENDDPGLSIVDIGQYRTALLTMLAADNKAVRSVFGDEYKVSISGLEQPVRWRVTGPLDLAIYFPYLSSTAPN